MDNLENDRARAVGKCRQKCCSDKISFDRQMLRHIAEGSGDCGSGNRLGKLSPPLQRAILRIGVAGRTLVEALAARAEESDGGSNRQTIGKSTREVVHLVPIQAD